MGHGRWAAITRCICLVVVAMASAAQVGTARADPVADFYRGKPMRMLIGYGPDGGYDIYGRLVAQFLPSICRALRPSSCRTCRAAVASSPRNT